MKTKFLLLLSTLCTLFTVCSFSAEAAYTNVTPVTPEEVKTSDAYEHIVWENCSNGKEVSLAGGSHGSGTAVADYGEYRMILKDSANVRHYLVAQAENDVKYVVSTTTPNANDAEVFVFHRMNSKYFTIESKQYPGYYLSISTADTQQGAAILLTTAENAQQFWINIYGNLCGNGELYDKVSLLDVDASGDLKITPVVDRYATQTKHTSVIREKTYIHVKKETECPPTGDYSYYFQKYYAIPEIYGLADSDELFVRTKLSQATYDNPQYLTNEDYYPKNAGDTYSIYLYFSENAMNFIASLERGHYPVGAKLFTVKIADGYRLDTLPVGATGLVFDNSNGYSTIAIGNRKELLSVAGSVRGGTLQYRAVGSIESEEWSTKIPAARNAGTYTVEYRVVDDDGNVVNPGGSFEVTIAKALAERIVQPAPRQYNGRSVAAFACDKNIFNITGDSTAKKYVGTYSTTVTPNENFIWSDTRTAESMTINWEVTPAPLTITGLQAVSRAYDGGTSVTLTGGTLNGLMPKSGTKDDVKIDITKVSGEMADANAGENKPVTIDEEVLKAALTGEKAGNYTITAPTGITVNITRGDRETLVSVENGGWEYDGTAHTPTLTGNVEELADSSVTYQYSKQTKAATETESAEWSDWTAVAPVDTGTYQVRAVIEQTQNYNAKTTAPAEFTIRQKELTVTGLTAIDREYDATEDVVLIGGQLDGVLPADAGYVHADMPNTGTVENADADELNSKQVTFAEIVLTGDRITNYTLKQPEVWVKISKATPQLGTVSKTSPDTIYNSARLEDIELSRTDTSVAGTLQLEAGQTLDAGDEVSKAGAYTWIFTPTDTTNYNSVTGTITLTVVYDALSSITAAFNPGANTSYTFPGTFDISTVTVTAHYLSGHTKDVTASVSYNPDLAVNQTTLSFTYVETHGVSLNTQSCTISGLNVEKGDATQYGLKLQEPRMQTYADDREKEYTISMPANSGAIQYTEGTVTRDVPADFNADDLSVSFVVDANGKVTYSIQNHAQDPLSAVGAKITLPVTVTSDNYQDATVQLVIEITEKIMLNASMSAEDKTYDGTTDANVTITVEPDSDGEIFDGQYTISEEAHFGDAAAGENKTVSATIQLSEETSYNYALNTENLTATATISQKALTITANDAETTYGDPAPAFSVTYDGFVNSENESTADLVGQLGFTCPYMVGDSAGDYTITPDGLTSNNYAITFSSGTMTVKKRQLSWNVDDLTVPAKLYDGTNAAMVNGEVKLEGVYSGDVENGNTVATWGTVTAAFADAEVGIDKDVTVVINNVQVDDNYLAPVATSLTLPAHGTIVATSVPLVQPTDTSYRLMFRAESQIDVTDDLMNIAGLQNPAQVADALRTKLLGYRINGKTAVSGNTVMYEITLLCSDDNGATWRAVTPEEFPADGIAITLPYQAGTNRNDFYFAVAHMLTNGSEAGTVEFPQVTLAESGVQFTLRSLSPVAMSWVEHDKPATNEPNSGNASNSGNAAGSGDAQTSVRKVPATGDNMPVDLLAALLVVSAVALAGPTIYRKKRK